MHKAQLDLNFSHAATLLHTHQAWKLTCLKHLSACQTISLAARWLLLLMQNAIVYVSPASLLFLHS